MAARRSNINPAVAFRKVHGAGNDFILITGPAASRDWRELAPDLCRRRTGIGADGLVVSERISPAAYALTCCNADGSVASMCGNALRCAARCAADDYGETRMTFLMCGAEHQARVDGENVSVTVAAGYVADRPVSISWAGRQFDFASVNTGTEHVVSFTDSVDLVDVTGLGRHVRQHPLLAPSGANVSFIEVVDRETLRIRTYERGVEAETLSCGSGAVAAASVARQAGIVDDGPVTVRNQGGCPLTVGSPGDPRDGEVWLTGPARLVFRGELP